MTLLEWRNEFAIGVAEVDFEHRKLFELINELYLDVGEGGARTADFLGQVLADISAHFALEEKVMREAKYARYTEHKADHEALLDEIREIMDRFDEGAYSMGSQDLGIALSTWFGRHFQIHDAQLHRALGK